MRTDSVLILYTICGPKFTNFNQLKFQIHVKYLLQTFKIFKLNKVKIHSSKIHICICSWGNERTKMSQAYVSHGKVAVLSGPDIEFDMPVAARMWAQPGLTGTCV